MSTKSVPSNSIKAVKSGSWYTVSSFLIKSIGFITTPFFTRLLTKEEFGLYNNYTSWLGILTVFVALDISSSMISARYDYEKAFDSFILSILALSTFSALIWIIILNIFHNFFTTFFGVDRIYINIMIIYIIFSTSIEVYQNRERLFFEYKKSVFVSVFISITTATLSMILVLTYNSKLTGRILGAAVPSIVTGAVIYFLLILKGKRIKCIYWKYALIICLPYIPHILSLTLLNSMDRIMITNYCGAEGAAMYSLSYNCGAVVTMLFASINNAYSPWLAEQIYEKNYQKIYQFSKIYIVFAVCFTLGVMIIAPEILLILGGRSYLDAQFIMPPVAMGCSCQFLYTMFVNVEQIRKKTIGMAFGSASAALLNYILNWIFIPKFGYFAAAYTTLVCYLWLLIIHMVLVYHLGLRNIYSYKYVFFIVGILSICMVGVNFIYIHTAIRYFILVIYIVSLLVVGYKKKNILLKFLIK